MSDTTPPFMLTRKEARLNFYFRGGDSEHMFETGQKHVLEWSGQCEYDVLLDRVSRKVKPVATMVDGRQWIKDCEEKQLRYATGFNEWGMSMLVVTAQPEATLMDLLRQREPEEQELVAHHVNDERLNRTVSRYVSNDGFGFDIDSVSRGVNVLESALLLGYPLEIAGACLGPLDWACWEDLDAASEDE